MTVLQRPEVDVSTGCLIVRPGRAFTVLRHAGVSFQHGPKTKLVVPRQQNDASKLGSPNMMQRLLGQALDGQGGWVGQVKSLEESIVAALLQLLQKSQLQDNHDCREVGAFCRKNDCFHGYQHASPKHNFSSIDTNALIFAQHYNGSQAEVTAAMVFSTVAFLFTAPLWLLVLSWLA